MAGRFSVEAQFAAIDRMTKPIDKMQRRINKFTRLSGRQFDQLNRKIGDFSAKTLQTVSTASIGGLSLALADGTRRAVEFEQTLVNAAAKFPEGIKKGTGAFKDLEKAARKTGAETEFSASQSAGALNFLAMAGFNAKQSIAALPGVVDLATAAQVELAEATDMATDTLGAFGLSVKNPEQLAKNLARVNDVLVKTTTSANASMEQLFETITEGGPVAKAAGASIETYAAFAGKLANAGIKASQAGTTLKNIFVSLSAQTPKAAKALAKLGVETQDEAGNLRDVVDIFEDINKGIQKEGLGTAEAAAVLKDVFGRIPIAGVNVLLGEGADKLRAYRREIEGATGASGKMAAQMRDTLKGQINSLMSAFEGLQLTVIGLNNGAFGKFIENMTESIRQSTTWIEKNRELAASIVSDIIDTVSGVVKIIGIMLAAFLAWQLVLLAMNAALLAFHATMLILKGAFLVWKGILVALTIAQSAWNIAMFISPVGLFVAAIVSLIAAGALLLEFWDPISDFFIGVWEKIGGAFETGIAFVTGLIEPFKQTVSGIGGLFEKVGLFFGGSEKETEEGKEKSSAAAGTGPQVVTQSEQLRRTVDESRETASAEVLIRDETGRAQMSRRGNVPGVKIAMVSSGDA